MCFCSRIYCKSNASNKYLEPKNIYRSINKETNKLKRKKRDKGRKERKKERKEKGKIHLQSINRQ